jgi:hypothetical protein
VVVLVRIEILEQHLTPKQREQLNGHLTALRRPGQKRRNLIPVLTILSTEDDTLDIDVEQNNS